MTDRTGLDGSACWRRRAFSTRSVGPPLDAPWCCGGRAEGVRVGPLHHTACGHLVRRGCRVAGSCCVAWQQMLHAAHTCMLVAGVCNFVGPCRPTGPPIHSASIRSHCIAETITVCIAVKTCARRLLWHTLVRCNATLANNLQCTTPPPASCSLSRKQIYPIWIFKSSNVQLDRKPAQLQPHSLLPYCLSIAPL